MAHLLDKQILYDGKKIRLEIHHLQDESGRKFKHEVVAHRGAVVILPILDRERVVLLRNRRHTVGLSLLELPAGTLEAGEDPINCAGRELQEETGYLAGRLKPIGWFFSSPGILTERMYAFAAFDLQPTAASPEPGEELQNVIVPLDEAIAMIRTADIIDAKTIAALLMYDRFHRND